MGQIYCFDIVLPVSAKNLLPLAALKFAYRVLRRVTMQARRLCGGRRLSRVRLILLHLSRCGRPCWCIDDRRIATLALSTISTHHRLHRRDISI